VEGVDRTEHEGKITSPHYPQGPGIGRGRVQTIVGRPRVRSRSQTVARGHGGRSVMGTSIYCEDGWSPMSCKRLDPLARI